MQQDEAVVRSDQANVEAASINLGYTRIIVAGRRPRRPAPGRCRQYRAGRARANGIVVVTQLQPMTVLFTLPEDNIGDIMARIGAGATLTADAYDRSQTRQARQRNARHRWTIRSIRRPAAVKLRALFDNTKTTSCFPISSSISGCW